MSQYKTASNKNVAGNPSNTLFKNVLSSVRSLPCLTSQAKLIRLTTGNADNTPPSDGERRATSVTRPMTTALDNTLTRKAIIETPVQSSVGLFLTS